MECRTEKMENGSEERERVGWRGRGWWMRKRVSSTKRKRGKNCRAEVKCWWRLWRRCGLSSRGVTSPRTMARKREIGEKIEGITEKLRRRNEKVGMLNARRRQKARRSRGVEQRRRWRGLEGRSRKRSESVEEIFEGFGAWILARSDRRMWGSECPG